MRAQKGDKVNLVLDNSADFVFWLIQKADEPEFFFSNTQHWTNDIFEQKGYWYHHLAQNLVERKEFEMVKPCIITFDIVNDRLSIYMDDSLIEVENGISKDKEAKEYIKKHYAYQIDKED